MVNPTPGGKLAKQLQEVLNNNPGPVKFKVQGQGGIQVKTKLQKSNPNKTQGCNSADCKHGRGQESNYK
jgi:hypothetical protein